MAKTVPCFNYYPGDMLMEAISSLSLAAQGAWLRMECIMHTSDRYGFLQINGKPMPDAMVARRMGVSVNEYLTCLREMDEVGWIQREARTNCIFSLNLLKQEDKRAKERAKKHNQRHPDSLVPEVSPSNSGDNFSEQGKMFDALPGEKEDVFAKSLETLNNCPQPVPALSPLTAGNGNGRGNGKDLALEEGVQREKQPPSASDMAREAAEQVERRIASVGKGGGKPLDPDGTAAVLVEEIALASPAGVALGWSALSIHGKHTIIGPVLDAVNLEAREQSLTEREAALYLLKRVRAVTAAEEGRPGWKRFWSIARMARFYEGTEYRNVERFTQPAAQDGGNAHGNSSRKRGSRDTSGNEATLRRVLESERRAGAQPQGGDSGVRDDAGGHAAGADDRADAEGVHGGAGRPTEAGCGDGVQQGAGELPVLPHATGAPRLRWPS